MQNNECSRRLVCALCVCVLCVCVCVLLLLTTPFVAYKLPRFGVIVY